MNKETFDLLNNMAATERKADKALTILGDLLQDYAMVGDEPTEKEAQKYAWEAKRIFHFIDISFDYVYDVKKELSQAYENLTKLYDLIKKEKAAPADDGQDGNYKEHIVAIISNLGSADLEKVYSFALSLMVPEVTV